MSESITCSVCFNVTGLSDVTIFFPVDKQKIYCVCRLRSAVINKKLMVNVFFVFACLFLQMHLRQNSK